MTTVHRKFTIQRHEYFIIPAGTQVSICNRDYVDNDPSTHKNIMVTLTSDLCVCSADDSQVEQLVEMIGNTND